MRVEDIFGIGNLLANPTFEAAVREFNDKNPEVIEKANRWLVEYEEDVMQKAMNNPDMELQMPILHINGEVDWAAYINVSFLRTAWLLHSIAVYRNPLNIAIAIYEQDHTHAIVSGFQNMGLTVEQMEDNIHIGRRKPLSEKPSLEDFIRYGHIGYRPFTVKELQKFDL